MEAINFNSLFLKSKLQRLVVVMSLFCQFSYSQTPGKEKTLAFINNVLGEQTSVALNGDRLVISFLDDKNKQTREDKVITPDLQLKITYEAESGLLCIPCFYDQPDCVTRVLVAQKIKRRYGRLSIPVRNEEDFMLLKKAFEHLIRMTSENGYTNAVNLD